MPVSWTTAWPFPRAISQRFRGSANAPATTSATDSAPQKSTSPTPASMAPGTSSMIPLSTISMTAIEAVSDASAIGMTAAIVKPARNSGRLVSV
jgi:hypothetical protein